MNRLIHARLLLAVIIASTIGAVEVGSLVAPAALAHAENPSAIVASGIPTLPTVVVHAPEAIPTLPVITVRPTAEQLAAASTNDALASTAAATSAPSTSPMLPHVRLDMPYYSFGKMLPNVIKD